VTDWSRQCPRPRVKRTRRIALDGVCRFDAIRHRLGISRKPLSTRLEWLVEHGLVEKVPYQQRPVRHEYLLTPRGHALATAFGALIHRAETCRQDSPLRPPGDGDRGRRAQTTH
jgi:DNA-binding HxlR family transcriptional regulator